MRAVGYARVSSVGQRERDTIASQLRLIPEYIARQGWTLVAPIETYVDDGRSAKAGKLEARDGFARLVRDADAKLFDVLVVVDIDRLTRTDDLEERARILGPFQRNGIDIVTTSGTRHDLRTMLGELYVTMQALVAAEENRKRSARIREGRITAARRGSKPGGATPYGLAWSKEDGWSINETRAPIVREMFERIAAGESCYEIGLDLEARGAPRKDSGTPWTRNRVWEIVRARYPVGEWLADVARHIVVRVPPLVTEELWQRAQVAMRSNRRRGLERTRFPYLLDGLATCGACGRPIRVRNASNNTRRTYVCAGRLDHGRGRALCDAPVAEVPDVDARVWGRIVAALEDPNLPELLAAQDRARAAEARDWEGDAAGYRRRLTRLEGVERALLTRFRRGTVGESALDAELAALHREREAVQEQLAFAMRAQAAASTEARALSIGALAESVRGASPELRREISRALIVTGSVVLHPDGGVELELDLPLDRAESSGPALWSGSVARTPVRIRVVAR